MLTLYTSPYRRMSRLLDVMDRMLEESLVETSRSNGHSLHVPVDVVMEDDGYTLLVTVPGLKPEDLHIEILDDTVTISGEIPAVEHDESAQVLLCERPAGSFRRTLTLPTALEPGKAEAHLENGVLRLYVPKAEAVRPKTIKVKAK